MLQFAASLIEIPEDVLFALVIVIGLAFCGTFGLLSLVAMGAEILNEDP
jgi:hypothetical protein